MHKINNNNNKRKKALLGLFVINKVSIIPLDLEDPGIQIQNVSRETRM